VDTWTSFGSTTSAPCSAPYNAHGGLWDLSAPCQKAPSPQPSGQGWDPSACRRETRGPRGFGAYPLKQNCCTGALHLHPRPRPPPDRNACTQLPETPTGPISTPWGTDDRSSQGATAEHPASLCARRPAHGPVGRRHHSTQGGGDARAVGADEVHFKEVDARQLV